MRLWTKANQIVQLLLLGVAASLLAVFLKDVEITLPNMAGGPLFAQVPLTIVLSLIPVVYISRVRDSNFVLGSITAEKPLFKVEGLIPLLVIIFSILPLLVLGALGISISWTIIQNIILLSGIQLIASAIVPPKYASLAPATWVLVAALFGNDFQNGSVRWWAFVINREPSYEGWVLSSIVLAVGVVTAFSISKVWRYKLFLWNK